MICSRVVVEWKEDVGAVKQFKHSIEQTTAGSAGREGKTPRVVPSLELLQTRREPPSECNMRSGHVG